MILRRFRSVFLSKFCLDRISIGIHKWLRSRFFVFCLFFFLYDHMLNGFKSMNFIFSKCQCILRYNKHKIFKDKTKQEYNVTSFRSIGLKHMFISSSRNLNCFVVKITIHFIHIVMQSKQLRKKNMRNNA